MKKKILIITLLLACLAACTNPNEGEVPSSEVALEPTKIVTSETPTPLPSYLPLPSDGALTKANALINSADLLALDTDPLQILLILGGYTPTPCHELRVHIPPPDEENNIMVEAYTVTESDIDCVQVLRAFDTKVLLGSYPSGSYWVWINGGVVGNFDT